MKFGRRDIRSIPARPCRSLAVMACLALGLAIALCAGCAGESAGRAAASFDDGRQVQESDVTAYVASYRKQQGLEGCDDAAWASFLAAKGLSPETLREKVIDQLVVDAMVEKRASELGVTVDEDELEEYLETFKGNLAFGDDQIYADTLAAQGQTVEQAEEGFRNLFLQRSLFEAEVNRPEVSDAQVLAGVANAYPEGEEARHVYRFTILGFDEEGAYDKLEEAQAAQDEFLEGKLTSGRFSKLVAARSDDEELKDAGGDDGWSIDAYKHVPEYRSALEETATGEVSKVFVDEEGYSFLWVDRAYSIPAPESGSLGEDALADMPESLLEALREGVAEQFWSLACQEYLQLLLEDARVEVNPMPSDVPYNVDMSLADA